MPGGVREWHVYLHLISSLMRDYSVNGGNIVLYVSKDLMSSFIHSFYSI